MNKKKALIIGGGPAGLTAALEFLRRTDIQPLVLEMTGDVGGISKTVSHEGNRMDIGGHRFFSKSDRVMDWWRDILPEAETPEMEAGDRVLLRRSRLSRIYHLRKFFDYPVTLSWSTLKNLGAGRTLLIGASYARSLLFPIRPEASLEDFFINRFGRRLYATFFKDYTEKVWGVPCSEIGADWGAQRVKGVSVREVLLHALKQAGKPAKKDMAQKDVETSLIDRFLYPKFGAGQMWEETARRIEALGGEIRLKNRVVGPDWEAGRVKALKIQDAATGRVYEEAADYVLSAMPVKDLLEAMGSAVPQEAAQVAGALAYRDFLSVGVLLKDLALEEDREPLKDNWIYIQEPDVKMGRIQLFHNWSPFMAVERNARWLGLEYFCTEGDAFWSLDDEALVDFAMKELQAMGFARGEALLGAAVARMPKAYPSYTGAYRDFEKVRTFTDTFENLFLIGRNGMHRYNNMDHSMLSAMTAVENIAGGRSGKDNLWRINAEQTYHEEKKPGEGTDAP